MRIKKKKMGDWPAFRSTFFSLVAHVEQVVTTDELILYFPLLKNTSRHILNTQALIINLPNIAAMISTVPCFAITKQHSFVRFRWYTVQALRFN